MVFFLLRIPRYSGHDRCKNEKKITQAITKRYASHANAKIALELLQFRVQGLLLSKITTAKGRVGQYPKIEELQKRGIEKLWAGGGADNPLQTVN